MEKSFQISLKIEDPLVKYVLMARSRGLSWHDISSYCLTKFGVSVNRQSIISKIGKHVVDECRKNKGIALSAVMEDVGI